MHRLIVTSRSDTLAWSPDGRRIYFTLVLGIDKHLFGSIDIPDPHGQNTTPRGQAFSRHD
jgi:hypothetical protein